MKKIAISALAIISAGLILLSPKEPPDPKEPTARAHASTRRAPRQPAPAREIPLIVIDPASLGISDYIPPIDHRARISAAIEAGDTASLVSSTVSWFSADPQATCEWLNSQPTLDDLQPALAGVAAHLAERGDFHIALQWAESITSGPEKDQTLFNIYALGYRQGEFPMVTLENAPLPPEMILELASGAAGD